MTRQEKQFVRRQFKLVKRLPFTTFIEFVEGVPPFLVVGWYNNMDVELDLTTGKVYEFPRT